MAIILILLSIQWAYNLVKLNLIKKEFYSSKQPIYLNQVEIKKIHVSDEFKLNDGVKNFTGYKNGETVKTYIILPQMKGIIKYFENNKKTCHFYLMMM